MFPRSRVKPLSLPALDHWAIKLRRKLRSKIKEGFYANTNTNLKRMKVESAPSAEEIVEPEKEEDCCVESVDQPMQSQTEHEPSLV